MSRHSEPSETFLLAVTEILDLEGGYVNDPLDPGGETNFGISHRQYPQLDIKSLTCEQAVDIYWRDYWLATHCHQLPPAFAVFLFGSAVNHRLKTAHRFLQLGLGVAPDGVIGPVTIAAAHNALDPSRNLAIMFSHRAKLYHSLVIADSAKSRFIRGWYKRLFLLQQFIFNNHLIEN
ncbi:MAG: glycosyl hydrolase 108 family protein [Porticoccus sp.]|nr:glycosyl hydrolase 108 family protein [Porticoccus sp.]